MKPQIFKTACSYCGVGCGIEVLKHPDNSLELRGDESHPANRGLLCSKGRSLLHTVRARDTRLHYPTMRPSKSSPRERVSWDRAINHAATHFKRIIKNHGPDAVAFYVSGQCLTEEYYLANKLVKGFLGTNNIDTNSRLCMSSAVAGYKATLGADGPPVCYDDIDHADTFFIAGANPAWCHPVLFRRIEARKAADPNVKIIVVDPRRTPSAQAADLHLQIKPGTDVALFLGIARRLVHTHQIDRDFINARTDGAHLFLQSVEPYTLARTAEICGIPEADIALAADLLGRRGDRFLSMWTMGLNQSAVGTDKNIALISLSLITGKIGKPGCGPFSLTGQPNAMGGREVGGLANLLSAHRDMSNPAHRQQVADAWGVPAVPSKPGLTAVELFDALAAKKVKAVWIIATNPVASLPAAWNAEKALAAAELVVVQDIYPTDTTDFADILLPAAGWLEKTGTMTNSDRRISLLEKAVEPPGEALADTDILLRFAHAMDDGTGTWKRAFSFPTVADIFHEHTKLTANTDIDITGVSHALLRSAGTTQWPHPASPQRHRDSEVAQRTENKESISVPPQRLCDSVVNDDASPVKRLYTDHLFPTPTRRAQLHPLTFEDRSEKTSPEFPLILTTGRIRDQWHTMTKTGQVNRLRDHIDSPFCEIHPSDAADRAISDGDIITITNPRGTVRVRATVTTDIRQGTIFLPMHWGKKLVASASRRCFTEGAPPAHHRQDATARANNLTSPRLDPISKEPDLKFATVQATKHAPKKRRIVIIGAGAAAHAFIEQHRQHNKEDSILLLGGESLPLYNRVMLPHYIDGSAPWDALITADHDALQPHQVVFHSNTLVSHINRAAKTVTDSRGRSFAYDVLILATGSRPAIHYDGPLPENGAFILRTRPDADAILAAAQPGKHAVIHGGGLLGLELADALRHRGCHVTILQRSDRLMSKQLDPTASAHLAEELAIRGIKVLFHTTPVELKGTTKVEAVRLGKHVPLEFIDSAIDAPTQIPCDLFIFATGTAPNKELAGAAILDCDKGILVNHHMQTSDPSIFAIGECAQHGDNLVGTTAGAQLHAKALAEFLRGNDHAPYLPAAGANILKIHGLQLAAAGIADPDPPTKTQHSALSTQHSSISTQHYETIVFHDPRRRTYQKCIIQNDRLVGIICMGDTSRFQQYLHYIHTGIELEDLRDTLLRPGTDAAPKLEGPLVCSCHHVGATTIENAARNCNLDFKQTCTTTKAGTNCGSCRPEITAILKKLQNLAHPTPNPLPTTPTQQTVPAS